MNTLKPCPFCGGAKICTEKSINLNYCDNCSAESNVEHWNIRPIEDDLRKRIAELEVEVTKGHELQDSYCDRIAKLEAHIDELEAENEKINYNDAVSAGKVSVDVKREADRNQFCPNCEAETPCTHEAELYVCDICGEDFAKYIVLRNCTLPDVSTTQDVTTPEPPEVNNG